MYDLSNSSVSHDIVREFYESGKIVSAVCHGPAALVNVKLSDGTYLIKGQKTTGFSNAEVSSIRCRPFKVVSKRIHEARNGHTPSF